VIGQAQIVVAGQVDDLFAVVVADRGLLVVEDAQLEVGAIGAQLVERGGQVGKLGRGVAWVMASPSKRKHSAAGAGLTHRAMSGFSRPWPVEGENRRQKAPFFPPIRPNG